MVRSRGIERSDRRKNRINISLSPKLALGKFMILGFDPGRDKCGVAVMELDRQVKYHQVVLAENAIATLASLYSQFPIELIVMGDQTTSRSWKERISVSLPGVRIVQVDERYSSLEARDRFWEMYPPQGFNRLIPQGMRTPPRPVDDIVAIVLIERYLSKGDV